MSENNNENAVNSKENDKNDKKPEIPKEKTSITKHTVEIDGKSYNYTATAGTMILKAEEDEKEPQAKATFFYVAYTLDDVENLEDRPLMFSFNGGPGSSSVWMHLGVLGPRIAQGEDENSNPIPPPYRLQNNQYSVLDKSELASVERFQVKKKNNFMNTKRILSGLESLSENSQLNTCAGLPLNLLLEKVTEPHAPQDYLVTFKTNLECT